MSTCKLCGSPLIPEWQNLFDDRYGYPGYFDVYYCPQCDFRQTEPGLSEKHLEVLYSQYYPRQAFDAEKLFREFRFQNHWLAKLKRWLLGIEYKAFYHLQPKTKILDIGYGNGTSLFFAHALGCDVSGIEVDKNVSLQTLAKKLDIKTEIGNIYSSKFSDRVFDCVTASQVIEHIPDPTKFLKTIRKKMKQNGVAILSFPNYHSLTRRLCGNRWLHWHIPYHLNHFSKKSFIRLAKKSGFTIVKIQTITPLDWSILQLFSLTFPRSNHKQAIELWSQEWVPPPQTGFIKIRNGMVKAVLVVLTRIIDTVKMGDSFVVVLKKR